MKHLMFTVASQNDKLASGARNMTWRITRGVDFIQYFPSSTRTKNRVLPKIPQTVIDEDHSTKLIRSDGGGPLESLRS